MSPVTDIHCDFTESGLKDFMASVAFHVVRWLEENKNTVNLSK